MTDLISGELAKLIVGTSTILGVFLGFALGHKMKLDNPNINYAEEPGPITLGFIGGFMLCTVSLILIGTFPWGILTVVTLTALYYTSKLFAKHLL